MSKKREKLVFENEDEVRLIFDEDKESEILYKVIEDNEEVEDYEKGIYDHDVIIQRLSDSKFFRGSYQLFGQGDSEYELEWNEVFQKTITQVVYE